MSLRLHGVQADQIGISEMIEEIRRELADSQRAAANKDLVFKYESVELDIAVAASKAVEGGAGVKVWVVDAETHGSLSNQNTHSVKVVLTPIDQHSSDQPPEGGTFASSG